jgi:hypothetical protein
MRADIILSLTAVTADGDVQIPYASATAGQRNTWLTNNADRVLFGSTKSNASSNVMATALATVDTTNDKLTAAVVSLAKRIAKTANPRIRPITVKRGRGMVRDVRRQLSDARSDGRPGDPGQAAVRG